MSHDQYLKGDLSLTITDADYTKRSLYTCACKGQELCDVSLQIEACNSSVQIKPGEPLVLDLLISESVEVIYNSTGAAAPSSGQICTVAGHSLKCKPEYTRRVSLISAVELRGTAPSDSGVYSIRDTKHEEIIQTYTVTVEGFLWGPPKNIEVRMTGYSKTVLYQFPQESVVSDRENTVCKLAAASHLSILCSDAVVIFLSGTGAELPLSHNPSRSHHSDHSDVQPCPNQSSTVTVLTVLLALTGAGLVAAVLTFRSPPSGLMSADESLANELNTFFARFEATSSSANASSTNANGASANSASANSANANGASANSANANGASANGTIGAANGTCAGPTIEQRPLIITESDVRRVFKRVNTRKAMGPDGICGRVLKACADQLAPVFTDIFNLSLTLGIVPSSFKRSTIVPVPKKPRPSDLNDYRPVALTSVVMKCFEKLVRDFITSSLPASTDPLQFAYRHNRSTDDAIAHLLHTTLTHLDEGRGNYVKMLFVDYSSAFNTIIPSLLTTKLGDLGLHTSLCDWISNFLTDRPQSVRVGNCASSTLTLSTGAPQGCVLSPLLYSLYTYDCTATSSSNTIVKFADDTVVVGLISDNDERAYLEEIKHLENWCQENNLLLNVSKTKELIVDCSKKQERHYQPVTISGTTVERVDSFRYLGVHISQDLSWSRHTSSLAKKARQRLFHLRRLRDFRLPSKVLRNFYTCTIESILTANITVGLEIAPSRTDKHSKG
ncbi:hypothetical protein P4O66_003963 [Electrophorus voltai]|uniref:Reverse transcriptase domain-containing protein n=1 Tax=Electrophorus voltai TaxID=2609070 RepID=A0AAD8YQJ1_9TELE|nr:hypothetical protein P4O66_003963 [Electrophorus voltai]